MALKLLLGGRGRLMPLISLMIFFMIIILLRISSPSRALTRQDNVDYGVSMPVTPKYFRTQPRISIVIIWEGGYRGYLPNMFASFRANDPLVELVWVDMSKNLGEGRDCLDVSEWVGKPGKTNIRAICLSRIEYYQLHRDYFCQRWRCSPEDTKDVFDVMMSRQNDDHLKSAFRLWRGYVFRKFMSPTIDWWGWADADTFMGSFESQFPWDAQDFDLIVPATAGNLLFMRGHLCFIRARSETEAKMSQYPTLKSKQEYVEKHTPSFAAEEGEFSAFIFRNKAFSFAIFSNHLLELGFDWMLPNTAKFNSFYGVYTMPWPIRKEELPSGFPNFPMLDLPKTPSRFIPTFSAEGVTRPIDVYMGKENYGGQLWFPEQYATWYPIDWSNAPEAAVRIIGRGGGFHGGKLGIWERTEPPRPRIPIKALHKSANGSDIVITLGEGLYSHFFEEKHRGKDWFERIPRKPIERGEVFVVYNGYGAEIWDPTRGHLVWRSDPKLA